jgi:hypothetical protein
MCNSPLAKQAINSRPGRSEVGENIMSRWAGALWFAVIAVAAPQPATACISYQPFDPDRVLEYLSREQIADRPEVIVEGVVQPYDPANDEAGAKDSFGMTTLRVQRVLKGDVEKSAVLLFNTQSMDCTHEPPFGQRIRFGATLMDTRELAKLGRIAWQIDIMETSAYRQALVGNKRYILYYENFDIPLSDPALNSVLEERQAETRALEKRATGGGIQAELAYADHLAARNESNRALEVYEATFKKHPDDLDLLLALGVARGKANRENEPEATLADVERKSPKTDEWRGKIARARYMATGRFTASWKDWSDLNPTQSQWCENRDINLDDASFDRSDLAGCDFQEASFRRGSFLGTDLTRAYFGYGPGPRVNMRDAKYDCATKFPQGFDPAGEGMINVEGSCPKP